MNKLITSFVTLSALSAGSAAFGQGLLSIRPERDEFEKKIPFVITLDAGAGYDSNTNLSKDNEEDSVYGTIGAGLQYQGGDRRTLWDVSLSYGGFYYFDAPENQDDYLQSARLGFNLRHKVNPRLTISDSLYFAYEFEPNYAVGAGTTRRTEPYIYGYNDVNVSYAWSRKFSTVTGYTISGIDYTEDNFEGESYLSHLFHQEFRFAYSRTTTLAFDYRFGLAQYDNGFGDYTSHYFLAGLDHSFSRLFTGSFRAGVEMRDRDNGGTSTNPYFEGSLNYALERDTSLNYYVRIGSEDSAIGDFQDRYSFRTGLTASHKFTERLRNTLGLHYIHDEFDDSSGSDTSFDEDVLAASVGFDFALYKNISLNTSYSFTTSSSGNEGREYDRHNVSVGVKATF